MAPQNELPLPPLQPQPVLGLGSWQWVSWLCLFSKEAQRWGKTQHQKAAVCESTVLYFQSVGLVKLDESVKVPPPGSSVLMARRLVFPPFHFLPVLLGQLKWKKQPVPQQTPAPGEKQRACSGDGLEWHSPGGGLPHLVSGCLASGTFSWRDAKFSPWPRRWWLSSCHPRVLLCE